MVSELVPSWKYANKDTKPQRGWILMTIVVCMWGTDRLLGVSREMIQM